MCSDSIQTLQTFDTGYHSDSVEWCPLTNYKDILLCGTYQLNASSDDGVNSEENKQRYGCLHIYQLTEDAALQHLFRLECSAVLDIKWASELIREEAVCGVADGSGTVKLFGFSRHSPYITELESINISENGLVLSLDWSPKNLPDSSANKQIISSTSLGDLHLIQLTESKLQQISQWKAHMFEPWICTFDKWNSNIIYSGGDDCKFKGWDIRLPLSKPVFISDKHSMGVTSIDSNPKKENILCTGSYDENVLLWDSRKFSEPLDTCYVGGGVWRLKWKQNQASYLVGACMHNGFHIMEFVETGKLDVVASYMEHGSLAYGVSWCEDRANRDLIKDILASCSFYDNSLHIWTWNHENKQLS